MPDAKKRWRRILVNLAELCGGLGGITCAAGAVLRMTLGEHKTLSEAFILVPLGVGGLALFVVPSWRKPRVVIGTAFAILMIVSFVAALVFPDLHRVALLK